jgi:hypothetical protein
VANLRQGQIVLLAPNSAAAAKLRLHSESLAALVSTHEGKAIVVSVKVQPNFSHEKHGAPHKKPVLSPAALVRLTDLYRRLPDSPVRRALRALLMHHDALPTRPPADAPRETPEESEPRRTGRT